jgi:7-methyl-GTP pyrophosphatase
MLASTSRYRAELLRRLLVDFEQTAPDVDETALTQEPPHARASRLAEAKARAVSGGADNALVIGSDQVAALGGVVLHKPGNIANALQQLKASSGNHVDFFTGLCLIDTRNGECHRALDHTRAAFRTLGEDEIVRYVERERPLDCAGSFKSEGLGITLFERIETTDPTALIGLPLIALARLLRMAGVTVP